MFKCEGGALGGLYQSASVMGPVSVWIVNHERSAVGESSVCVIVMGECVLLYARMPPKAREVSCGEWLGRSRRAMIS